MPTHHGDPIVIEATGKKWKGCQLLGVAVLAIGFLFVVLALQIQSIGLIYFGVAVASAGLGILLYGYAMAWWHHG